MSTGATLRAAMSTQTRSRKRGLNRGSRATLLRLVRGAMHAVQAVEPSSSTFPLGIHYQIRRARPRPARTSKPSTASAKTPWTMLVEAQDKLNTLLIEHLGRAALHPKPHTCRPGAGTSLDWMLECERRCADCSRLLQADLAELAARLAKPPTATNSKSMAPEQKASEQATAFPGVWLKNGKGLTPAASDILKALPALKLETIAETAVRNVMTVRTLSRSLQRAGLMLRKDGGWTLTPNGRRELNRRQ